MKKILKYLLIFVGSIFCLFFLLLWTLERASRISESEQKVMDDAAYLVLQQEKVDQKIVENLAAYERLKDFLVQHADTLIKYNKEEGSVLKQDGTFEPIYTEAQRFDEVLCNDCLELILKRIPSTLQAEFTAIYNQVVAINSSVSITIDTDKLISIKTRHDVKVPDENHRYCCGLLYDIRIDHILYWNKSQINTEDKLEKDTALTNNCYYSIQAYTVLND